MRVRTIIQKRRVLIRRLDTFNIDTGAALPLIDLSLLRHVFFISLS
jgi:hypothetical protein